MGVWATSVPHTVCGLVEVESVGGLRLRVWVCGQQVSLTHT